METTVRYPLESVTINKACTQKLLNSLYTHVVCEEHVCVYMQHAIVLTRLSDVTVVYTRCEPHNNAL